MFYDNTTFVGIDPTAGQKPFVFSALDQDRRLLALGEGDIEDVLAFVAGLRTAFVAVSSPSRPNQGVLKRPELRRELNPAPRPGRWRNFRLVEYQLRQHNLYAPQTGDSAEECPMWMQMGFKLYKGLGSIGYKPFPQPDAALQWMEVYPHACYASILGVIPFQKNSLEGRLQRQLALHERSVDVPDGMRIFEEITRHRLLNGILPLEDLHSPEELDALVAAYTAWQAATNPEEVCIMGHPDEGEIILPVASLKPRY